MKTRKKLTHQALVGELFAQLKFPVKVRVSVLACITVLTMLVAGCGFEEKN
jgi:hypothetical protein